MSTRLPGRPRPQAEARAEFDRHRVRWISTQAKPQTAAILADFLYGNAEHMHRWRIQLDCGHIHEVFTRGKDQPPAGERWINCLGDKLAQGEYPCYEQSCHRDVDRDIVSWDKRQDKETPPDPEDPPDWWHADPALWARTRRDHPRANWDVTLTCGHPDTANAEPDWKPEDGITRNPLPADKLAKARAVLAAVGEPEPRSLLEGCPEPTPWTQCWTCSWARTITVQEYVGPLVGPTEKRPAPDPRTVLQRRLQTAERQAADLRRQLAALDPDEP